MSMAAAPSSTTSGPVVPRWMLELFHEHSQRGALRLCPDLVEPGLAEGRHGTHEHDLARTQRADHGPQDTTQRSGRLQHDLTGQRVPVAECDQQRITRQGTLGEP